MAADDASQTGKDPLAGEGLRHRKLKSTTDGSSTEEAASLDRKTESSTPVKPESTDLVQGTYWLTRVVLLRAVGGVYFVAFLVALHQNGALLGKNGLLPADKYLEDASKQLDPSPWGRFLAVPTVLWLVDYGADIDFYLNALAWTGLVLSASVVILGSSNIIIMLILWIVYHSIVNIGQRWYSFGWESQILETGFLAAFLCPLLSLRKYPESTPTSKIVIWAFIWLIFRIMLGAGLIKLRGDKCWWDLTCMNYHYQTQPVPNPISYYMHQEPELFHKFETMVNHFVELPAPFFFFMGRRMRIIGGVIQILFQVIIIISGNLSFLNWLTIIPSLACFDDCSLSWMFPSSAAKQVHKLQHLEKNAEWLPRKWSRRLRGSFNFSLGMLLAFLSFPIIQNLLSRRQIMNTSFESFRIVNTYGAFGRLVFDILWALGLAYLSLPVVSNMYSSKQKMNHYFNQFRVMNTYGKFGSITKERTEVIFQGTHSLDPNDPSAKWLEYEFKCKPGDVSRRPCLISPYHYRLDWLMWFAAFQRYNQNPWLIHLAAKFLTNDEGATSLIAVNPFAGTDPPRYVRAEHYRYSFTKFGSRAAQNGTWWKRVRIGSYLPAVSLDDLKEVMKQMGWNSKSSRKKSKAKTKL